MTITFVGHGYVGLVTACIFADFGNEVYVVGHTPDKIERLKNGDPLIYEPGLKELLEKNLKAGRIYFTLSFQKAIPASEIVFIAVGTPPKPNGDADLSAVLDVADKVGKHLKNGFTVVSCKSTVPVGTNKKVAAILNKVKPKSAKFAVASCPEFLREGSAIFDTLNPDRVVIGSSDQKAIDLLLALHKSIDGKRVITDLSSAELIKYTSNAMLATKISFANLISFYCEKIGANVETVLDAVGLDRRIGRIFMDSGVGYGGSCLPKDVNALLNIGKQLKIDTSLFAAVERINADSRNNIFKKIISQTKGKIIAIWGLTFKPNTDDIREAPSLFIINELLKKKCKIKVFDPAGTENVRKIFKDKIEYKNDPYEAVKDAYSLVILTEWNEFRQIDLARIKKLMRSPLIIDGRNIYNQQTVKQLGFRYLSTGRKAV